MNAPLPSLPGLPLVGCLPELRRDRLGFLLRAVRDGGELVAAPTVPGRALYVASAPGPAREVLVRKAEHFQKFAALSQYARPVLGDGLISSEGPLHRRQRRLIAPKFGRSHLESYAATMSSRARELAERWRGAGSVDLHAEATRLTLGIATETMFSSASAAYSAPASAAVHAATDYIAGEVGRLVHVPVSWPLPRNRRMQRAVAALDEIVYRIIAERRAGGGEHDDILQRLLDARDEEDGARMDDRQVRDEVMTLFVAGHETTANAVTWSLYLLARHPEVAAALARECDEVLGDRPVGLQEVRRLTLTEQVVKEAMRLYPPAYMVGRQALQPVELGGHLVPAGATVLVNIYGIHRHPELYPQPERFDPDHFSPEAEERRPRGSYLPFGDGPRVCIGSHFAMVETQIVLAELCRRVNLRAPDGPPVRPVPRVTLRPGAPIRLSVAPRG